MAFPSRHKTLYKSALSIHTERTDERFQTAHHRIVTADQVQECFSSTIRRGGGFILISINLFQMDVQFNKIELML